jgi:glycosyltransferase involved in cell wall biosynthesis
MATFRILHTESSQGMGGQEYRVLAEAQGMGRRGHQVVIAAPTNSPLLEMAREAGVTCEELPVGLQGWVRLIPLFLRLISRYHIQVIHTHGSQDSWTASLAARVSPLKPIIIRARHKSTKVSKSFRHMLLYRRLPHALVTTGEALREQFIVEIGLHPAAVFSIPTGVDLKRFYPKPANTHLKEGLGIAEDGPVIGTVAFLRPEKGIELLIDAVELLRESFPRLQCVIVGNGPAYHQLLGRVHERKLDRMVTFTGFRQDIPDLLRLMDVVVLPSLSGEGLPQALTQALALERPVVASRDGAIPEVVRDGQTGLLADPNEPGVLAGKVAFLLQHPERAKALGKAGRELVERQFSEECMLLKTEEVYRRVWERWKHEPSE